MRYPSHHPFPLTRRRFTLLEVMIATLIMAVLAALILAAGTQVMGSWTRIQDGNRRLAALLLLDRSLDHMLSNLIPFSWPDPEKPGTVRQAFAGEPDRVRFCYRHELNSAEDGTLRFAGLVVDGGNLVAVTMERPFLDWQNPEPNWNRSVLARGVKSIRLRYADLDPAKREVTWTDQWSPERQEVPLAVWIFVAWEDGREESWLRRTAGNGQYERLGAWQPALPGQERKP